MAIDTPKTSVLLFLSELPQGDSTVIQQIDAWQHYILMDFKASAGK